MLFKPRDARADDAIRLVEDTLRGSVEAVAMVSLHPRTAVRVVLQSLTEDGSLLSALANAACVALLDAGVQLSSLLLGATVAVMPDGALWVDPTAAEEAAARAVLDLVVDARGALLASRCRGAFDAAQFQAALALGAGCGATVAQFMREATAGRVPPKK